MGLIAAGVAGVLAPVAAAGAQDRDGGFWGSFGIGQGWNATPVGSTTKGAAGYLRLGGTVNSHLLLGGETVAWAASQSTSGSTLTVSALMYPSNHMGFVVKAGLGLARADSDAILAGASSDTSGRDGLGAILGVGWEIRLFGNTYVTIGADWVVHTLYGDGNPLIRSPNHFLLLHFGPMWH